MILGFAAKGTPEGPSAKFLINGSGAVGGKAAEERP